MQFLFKPLTPASDRMLNLDALRFLAALGVMFLHAAHLFEVSGAPLQIAVKTLNLLVDLFFTISGYVMGAVCAGAVAPLKPRAVARFWFGRFARLYPLHLLMLLAFLAVGALGAGQTGNADNYSAACIPANLILSQAWGGCAHESFNIPAWSLSAEAALYAVLPLLAWVSARSRLLLLLAALGLIGGLSWLTWAGPVPWYYWKTPQGALRALPSFLLGLSLWNYRGAVARLPFAQAGLWIAITAYVAGVAWRAPPPPMLVLIWLIAVFAVASDAHKGADPVMRALAPLGTLTYASYMIHSLVFIVLLTLGVDRVLHLHGAVRNVVIFAVIALTFALAWPVENLADAVKRWLNKAVRI